MNPIRSLRIAHSIPRHELASALGVSVSTVSRMERGTPSEDALRRGQEAVEAILEFRRLWAESPTTNMEDWMRARAPLLRLAASRKRRDPVERQILTDLGDPVAALETEERVKVAGQRATRKMR